GRDDDLGSCDTGVSTNGEADAIKTSGSRKSLCPRGSCRRGGCISIGAGLIVIGDWKFNEARKNRGPRFSSVQPPPRWRYFFDTVRKDAGIRSDCEGDCDRHTWGVTG